MPFVRVGRFIAIKSRPLLFGVRGETRCGRQGTFRQFGGGFAPLNGGCSGGARVSRVTEFKLAELLAARERSDVDLWGRTINPQFSRVLKKIGFDREWVRTESAYLWDRSGEKYLDMLGGFGMFNVGRNNPRIRAALIEALELDLPGAVQLGASPLPPLLAEALLARAPERLGRVLFTSSGTEAVEAALKLGRAATRRPRIVSLEHAFHGLTLGSLSAHGHPEVTSRFGPLLPGFDRVTLGDLDALEAQLRR